MTTMTPYAVSNVTQEDIARLLSDLRNVLQAVPVSDQLWDAAAIGNWMGLSPDTVTDAVVVREGFPAPVQPTDARHGKRLWFADEVIKWARANRGRLPKGRGRPRRA